MQTHYQVRKFVHQNIVVRLLVRMGGVAFLALFLLAALFSVNVVGAHASTRETAASVKATGTTAVANTAVSAVTSKAAKGSTNVFPYPACTWWANQRYRQLHGFFVPWTTNSMAWQWKDRARNFGWQVSSQPKAGAIINLQPWVQGAYGAGHVAVVERVLKNGHVIASSMSWGANPSAVKNWEFAPGPGVTFISY